MLVIIWFVTIDSMGIRKIDFTQEEYYHVYNRGVDKREVFLDREDILFFYKRLIDLNKINQTQYDRIKRKRVGISSNNSNKLVDIIAFCLLPNHFHIILKPNKDDAVSKIMQKLGTSYTNYFNKKYKRSGSLFQGKFKAKHIQGELALPTLVTYVNLNYKHHSLEKDNNLVKSSLDEYLKKSHKKEQGGLAYTICETNEVIDQVGGPDKFIQFMKNTESVFMSNKGIDLNSIHWNEFEY